MKLGLMTIFQVPNLGSVLQTFATQTILQKAGHECDVINYIYPNHWHFAHGTPKPSILKKRVKKLLWDLGLNFKKYDRGIEIFRLTRLNLTRRYADWEDLAYEDWSEYDALITGSDQVWNSRFTKGDSAFMLSYTNCIKKISIASSFACTRLPLDMIEKYRRHLSAYSAISVREKSGIEILSNQLHISCPSSVILDPTLLLSGEEWASEMQLKKTSRYGKYLLLYVMDYAFEPRPQILEIAANMQKRYGCDSIITFSGGKSPEVRKLKAIHVEVTSVEDFLSYVKNAEVVVTSSFHGTSFALNFSKPLISVYPKKNDERQQWLLDRLGVAANGVAVGDSISGLSADYDSDKVQQELALIRKRDLDWIMSAINS